MTSCVDHIMMYSLQFIQFLFHLLYLLYVSLTLEMVTHR